VSHCNLHVDAKYLYSTSKKLLEMILCFFERHVIKE